MKSCLEDDEQNLLTDQQQDVAVYCFWLMVQLVEVLVLVLNKQQGLFVSYIKGLHN